MNITGGMAGRGVEYFDTFVYYNLLCNVPAVNAMFLQHVVFTGNNKRMNHGMILLQSSQGLPLFYLFKAPPCEVHETSRKEEWHITEL